MSPEELSAELAAMLGHAADTLEVEADILERAHGILQDALKGKEG
ncbi:MULTISPECIES: hypothetical protein [unclassified Corynebacterium]|nr:MULTISPECIES: hypothetical protein [unclassified Corynebacterium]